jgi:hypothetical protein
MDCIALMMWKWTEVWVVGCIIMYFVDDVDLTCYLWSVHCTLLLVMYHILYS